MIDVYNSLSSSLNNDYTSRNVNENVNESNKQLGNEPAITILAEPQKQSP